MRILLIGNGRMGSNIKSLIGEDDEICAAVGSADLHRLAEENFDADVIIDFSAPEALPAVCEYVMRTGTPLVSGTTGYSQGQKDMLFSLKETAPVLWSSNFSIGIAVMRRMLKDYSQVLFQQGYEAELVETHHHGKKDAPSGTAKTLLDAMDPEGQYERVFGRGPESGMRTPNQIGVHAVRGGTVTGTHSVSFFGMDESIEICHTATDRKIFAEGALAAASKLCGRDAGLYEFEEIFFG